jgi:hypothetical protein
VKRLVVVFASVAMVGANILVATEPPAPPPAAKTNTARAKPTAAPIVPGFHLERQVASPSGNLRVEYMRDRQKGVRQIVLQDTHNPSNSTVLAQYSGSAWVLISPNDDWIVLNSRGKNESGTQLYHRLSNAPLKYEVPEQFRGAGAHLQDAVWQSYLGDTQQGDGVDRSALTIDATSWSPDSHQVSFSVAPRPIKGSDATPPIPWTCVYDVTSKQIVPTVETTQESADESADRSSNETAEAPAKAQTETAEAPAANEETQELEGEKYPATREEPITIADANELTLPDIRYAINEMFARHGAPFKDVKVSKTFSQFSWYEPQPDATSEEIEAEFSEVEKHNLAVLRRCRDAKISAAHRTHQPLRGERVYPGERVLPDVLQGIENALDNQ